MFVQNYITLITLKKYKFLLNKKKLLSKIKIYIDNLNSFFGYQIIKYLGVVYLFLLCLLF